MPRLNEKTLHSLLPAISVPSYDRQSITPGIVHIGVGGFHRAHEAVYTDDIMARGGADNWGICGIGLRPEDKSMRDALLPQDGLYTVVTRSADGDQARIVGSLVRYLFAPEEAQAVQDILASPQTRIVSMTITEGGYAAQSHGPESVFVYLADALERRRSENTPPFTVLSCDNLPNNGDAAKHALLSAAAPHGDLAAWIEQNVAFPNSMVDRITPQTTDADRALVQDEFGMEDAWPVVCEPFKQWIIEDKFSDGRPPWENAGAQFVSDVAPYETMKLSLLNGSHFAMAYLGFLAGYGTVPEVMADPQFRLFIQRLMDDEVTPLLLPVPGIDLTDYKATLLTRFDNPAIKDQVTRLCLNGSGKFPQYLLPSLQKAMRLGRPHRLLTLALAGWLRYLTGTDEQGRAYLIDDPQAAALTALAAQGGPDPRPLLSDTETFGDLGQSEAFVRELSDDLRQLYAVGAQKTLVSALGCEQSL
jgi:mannitol 2-dehydrogenase